ncbi:hypothetical protein [Xylocopilactobacillus apicola]|uniref:Uncharacterized protein n=1 Tax=Xylocopilactobacillus apicola TaxID=2932184 RepID=A0AAU9DCC6_9LACO|nr:hypothetical protein [Xylocopilactobacillus apicola]BDR59215.1 hypothetical protein XA3_16560 [Xylocopilactobacillus apicola]
MNKKLDANKITISRHAKQRLKERAGIHKKGQKNLLEKVIQRGLQHGKTKGNLFKWMNKIMLNSPNGSRAYIYSNNVYIFAPTTEDHWNLITVLPVAASLQNLTRVIRSQV